MRVYHLASRIFLVLLIILLMGPKRGRNEKILCSCGCGALVSLRTVQRHLQASGPLHVQASQQAALPSGPSAPDSDIELSVTDQSDSPPASPAKRARQTATPSTTSSLSPPPSPSARLRSPSIAASRSPLPPPALSPSHEPRSPSQSLRDEESEPEFEGLDAGDELAEAAIAGARVRHAQSRQNAQMADDSDLEDSPSNLEADSGPYNGDLPPPSDGEDDDEDAEEDWLAGAGLHDEFEDLFDDLDEEFERELAETEHIISDYDMDMMSFFAYKNSGAGITNDAYRKLSHLPALKRRNVEVPSYKAAKRRVEFLSAVKPVEYDCCINSCCCYAGPNADKTTCPHCNEPRYTKSNSPRRRFRYLPITPRLKGFYSNAQMSEKMRYRHTSQQPGERDPDKVKDMMDGTHYQHLTRTNVVVDGKEYSHKFFDNHHDVALGLSTDGFAPFRRRSKTCWPIILFNYNLPPEIRFWLKHILCLGVIPGPHKPKDYDSYFWPALEELLRLAIGVPAFDVGDMKSFRLRAYLIAIFGDIPAVAMIMRMKGHNAFLPCRMCNIAGVRIPDKPRVTTHYVPLDRANHPSVRRDRDAVKKYDGHALPLRTHDEIVRQAHEIEAAPTATATNALSRQYGINGTSILYDLPSISFPTSFPYDFMHLVFENVMKQLILLWTGGIEGLDEGTGFYRLMESVWQAIGVATARSGATIPSIFTTRPPNCAEPKGAATADTWSFWLLYLGPRLLARRFRSEVYYHHFVKLSKLVHKCLQFEISKQDIADLRTGFVEWVNEFEKLYYQQNPARVSICTINIHALLHIADSIEAMGPVWTYWAFPMERYCGSLQRAMRSRRFPWSNLDEHVVATAQLAQVKLRYNLEQELSLAPPASDFVKGQYSHAAYPTCILLPRRYPSSSIDDELFKNVKAHLATRYSSRIGVVNRLIKVEFMEQFARVRRLEGGDEMHAAKMIRRAPEDYRDRTFVKYVGLVDQDARFVNRPERLTDEASYGQLLNIILVTLPAHVAVVLDRSHGSTEPAILFLAHIQPCIIDGQVSTSVDAATYKKMSDRKEVVDIGTVQCLVGRTPLPLMISGASDTWAIIDRGGEVNQPDFVDL